MLSRDSAGVFSFVVLGFQSLERLPALCILHLGPASYADCTLVCVGTAAYGFRKKSSVHFGSCKYGRCMNAIWFLRIRNQDAELQKRNYALFCYRYSFLSLVLVIEQLLCRGF